jgi:hypothetical protein
VTSIAGRGRVVAVAIAVITVAAPACSSTRDPDATTAATPTSVVAEAPTDRSSCEAAVPTAWQRAIDGSAVSTGGASNVPAAVGRGGEVAVVRDGGNARDLLLVGADKSVADIYSVPDPDQNDVGFSAMDDRWVVVGVQRAPRGANGIVPPLFRIDVVDRQGGAERTVAQSSEEDLDSGGATIDSVALFGGKVYWITHDSYTADTGTIRSYDLNTGVVAEMASGAMRNVRTTAAGLAWAVASGDNGTRAELKIPDQLPPPVAGALGAGQDQMTLATDGTAYAWFTGTEQGGTGVAWWSPTEGLVRIAREVPDGKNQVAPLYVVGPYVVLNRGRSDGTFDTLSTVIDTRSGAFTYLRESVGGADGGTIAVGLGGDVKKLPTLAGVVRADALPPLTC